MSATTPGPTAASQVGAAELGQAVHELGQAVHELGQAVHELVAGRIDLEEFARRFLAARVYTLSPVCPGLFVLSRPGAPAIVPVWSTVRGLRQATGGYELVACTGAELLAQMPAGVGVLIDDGMPCPITLPAAVLLAHRQTPRDAHCGS